MTRHLAIVLSLLTGLLTSVWLASPALGQGKPLRFVMSSTPSFTWTPFLVAQTVAFDELTREVGGKIEITYAPTPAPAVLALLAGEQDIGIIYVQHAVKAQAEGKDIVVLAALMENPTVALLARPDLPEIKSPADLKGRVFGIVGLGSGHHLIGLALARAYNVNPDDVTWRSTGGVSGWIPAMRAKRVDVMLASEPTISRLVDEGLGRVILDLHAREATEKVFGGPHPTVAILARRAYVEANPRIAQAVVDAHLKTLRWIHSQPPKAIAAALPETLQKQPNVEAILARIVPAVSKTGEVTVEAVRVTIEGMKAMGELDKNLRLDPAAVIESRFVRASRVPAAAR